MSELSNLIPISYDNPERPTVSGRELHEFLEVGADYRHWFPRMCEYGFTEGEEQKEKPSTPEGVDLSSLSPEDAELVRRILGASEAKKNAIRELL